MLLLMLRLCSINKPKVIHSLGISFQIGNHFSVQILSGGEEMALG